MRRPDRILIVDDSRLQRHILKRLVADWGYAVSEAESGAEALRICQSDPPDLVISDWMMPGMDGIAFCRALRALERESYCYFILLTSKAEKLHVAEGLDAGADDFLSKPVGKEELRARLTAGQRILDMSRELRGKNRLLGRTLEKLQKAHEVIDNDLVEAKKLQQSLVRERQRDFGEFRASLLLRPAGRVGGDLVGFYPINADWFGCFALDVSGHGISSALMTARLAGYLSAASPDRNLAIAHDAKGAPVPRGPADVAARLNALVLGEITTELYFTMVLAHVQRSTGLIRLVQAGHPHPLLQGADGGVQQIGQGGLPVGLLPGAPYEETLLHLEPGGRLLIASDGITEAPDAGGAMLEAEGLTELLKGLRDSSGTGLLEALVWSLGERAGPQDFPDDISAVLLERAASVAADRR